MPPIHPLLSVKNLRLGFGGAPLFQGVDVHIGRGDRFCLVGRNGSGKSTLLKAMAGLLETEDGTRFVQPGVRVAYLPQDPDLSGFASVRDYVAAGLGPEQDDERHRIAIALQEFDLRPDAAPLALSGGEARRVAIARVLISEPDLLLLDEPTNHLDLPTIKRLEERLDSYRGGFVLISHDRAFLSRLARTTLWLDRGSVRRLDAGFDAFEPWSAALLAQEEAEVARLDKRIARETHWSHHGIEARRTRNMGRMRALQSMRRERAAIIAKTGAATMELASAPPSGRMVVEAQEISKSFGSTSLIRSFSTRILRGDRVGLIGPNGAGKSTLLNLLSGRIPPDEGTVRLGTNLQTLYLDQSRSTLDPNKTLWETLADSGGDSIDVRGTLRHVLGYMRDFLFSERQARSPVGSLSGGERNRLLLAKSLARPSNLLILDEPTNDLDLETLDLLQSILADYEGTLLLVSHDRDFLDRVVASTIVFEGGGVVREYPGGYDDYERQRPKAPPLPKEEKAKSPLLSRPVTAKSAPRSAKLSYKQQRALEELPHQIEVLRRESAALEKELADPSFYRRDPQGFQTAVAALETKKTLLAEAEDVWLELEILREELGRDESGR